MRNIRLVENTVEYRVRLTKEERDTLTRVAPSILVTPSIGETGFYNLTPGSHIGTVNLGRVTLEIHSKLTELDRVLFLLSYALNPTLWTESGFDYGERSSLLEAIIPGFLAQLRSALRRGMLQGYRVEEATLLSIKGRIRFDDQIRDRYGVLPPVEVRYDEFTEDIEINRLLKSALVRLERMRLRRSELKPRIRAFGASFERVEYREYTPSILPDITYSRLNEHYKPAVELAKLILVNSAIELEKGATHSSCFLVNMNKVFEDFVVVALRERLGLTERVFPQNCRGRALFLDLAHLIALEPDISWWNGELCRFVGDVKYKKVAVTGIKHPDLYQLLAYTTAAGLDSGLLIYASGEGEPAFHEVVELGKSLRVESLDLSGGPAEILEEVGRIAESMRAMYEGSQKRSFFLSSRTGDCLEVC